MRVTRRQLRRIIAEAGKQPSALAQELAVAGKENWQSFNSLVRLISKILNKIMPGHPEFTFDAIDAAYHPKRFDVPFIQWVEEDLILGNGIDESEYVQQSKATREEAARAFAATPWGKKALEREKKEKEKGGARRVPIDANTGTGLAVDAAASPDDVVDSISGDATDPTFLRKLAGWLQQMDNNPAVQKIMYNLD